MGRKRWLSISMLTGADLARWSSQSLQLTARNSPTLSSFRSTRRKTKKSQLSSASRHSPRSLRSTKARYSPRGKEPVKKPWNPIFRNWQRRPSEDAGTFKAKRKHFVSNEIHPSSHSLLHCFYICVGWWWDSFTKGYHYILRFLYLSFLMELRMSNFQNKRKGRSLSGGLFHSIE